MKFKVTAYSFEHIFEVDANNAGEAAVKAVKIWDEDENEGELALDNYNIQVFIEDEKGCETEWMVTGRMRPEYISEKIEQIDQADRA